MIDWAQWRADRPDANDADEGGYRLYEARCRCDAADAALAAWSIATPTIPAGATDVRDYCAANGVDDDTAGIAAAIAATSAGGALSFPAGTYRVEGSVTIDKALAIVGSPGAIVVCAPTGYRFVVAGPDPGTPLTGVSISGLTFTGIDAANGVVLVETPTAWGPTVSGIPSAKGVIVEAVGTDGLQITGCRFVGWGYSCVRLRSAVNSVVDDCVFEHFFKDGLGYGVSIYDTSDDTTVRNCYFDDGRHAVAIGATAEVIAAADPNLWCKAVTVEDCYARDMEDCAFDAHAYNYGPYTIRSCSVRNSYLLATIQNDLVGSLIEDCVAIECRAGIWADNQAYAYGTGNAKAAVDIVRNNTLDVLSTYAICTERGNANVAGNVLKVARYYPAVMMQWPFTTSPARVDPDDYSCPTEFEVTGNIYGGGSLSGAYLDRLTSTADKPTLVSGNAYIADLSPLVLSAAITPAVPVTGEAVQFADATTGPAAASARAWGFGDGDGSAAQHPTHAYPSAGVYPVTLTSPATSTAQTVTVVPGVSYGGARLSEADIGPLDHDPVANATDLHNGSVRLQGSPVSRRAWTVDALADDHDEIEALAALKGQHLTLNINGVEYPGTMIRPPMLETQLTPAAWAYQVGFVQETRHA